MRVLKLILPFLLFFLLIECSGPNEVKQEISQNDVQRKGWVIRLKPGKLKDYKDLHKKVWPGILKKLKEVNIRNYTIFYRDGLLFSYFEYTGNNFAADMNKMAVDSLTQEWWKLTNPCQEPIKTAGEGVWWADMEEVFHMD